MRRGDVYWLEDPKRRRPVVVMTRDAVIGLLTKVVVAPATGTIRNIPSEVRLGPADGMPSECVVSFDNIKVVPRRALRRKITSLPESRLDELCEALVYAMGC